MRRYAVSLGTAARESAGETSGSVSEPRCSARGEARFGPHCHALARQVAIGSLKAQRLEMPISVYRVFVEYKEGFVRTCLELMTGRAAEV